MFAITDHDGVALLEWTHGKAHVLDLEFLNALDQQFQQLAADAPTAVVIKGAGSVFSAGVDLFRMLDEGREYIEAFLPALDRTLQRMATFERPLVAAVNGHCIAGGYLLAVTADLRIAVDRRAKIGVPEVAVGVPFPVWGVELIRAVVAPPHFPRVVGEGEVYSSEQALTLGMVDELQPAEQILATALEHAHRLGALPPRAFSVTKGMLREPYLERARTTAERDRAQHLALWSDPATLQIIRDYLARTVAKK